MVILFDLDGTVIDSTEAIVESFYYACDQFAFAYPPKEEIAKLIGHPLDIMFISVGVKKERVWDFVAAYKEQYRKISKAKTVLLPRAKEAIELASSFARLGVVTTKTAQYSRKLLEHFEMMRYFEVLIGREDVKHPKPHPEPIFKALAIMEADPKKSYIIGDTILDLEAAQKADIGAVAVLSGYGIKQQLEPYGYAIVQDVYEAALYLKNITMKKR